MLFPKNTNYFCVVLVVKMLVQLVLLVLLVEMTHHLGNLVKKHQVEVHLVLVLQLELEHL